MSQAHLPRKKDVALALLEKSSVFIHLDPRVETVRVPLWFKKQPQLVLQVGLNMAVPIPDLNVDDECVSCTLSFSRSPFYCVIPWAAIYAMVGEDSRGMVWPDDIPPEVAAQNEARAQKAAEEKRVQDARARLHAVPAADAGRAAPPPPTPIGSARPRVRRTSPADDAIAQTPGEKPAKAPRKRTRKKPTKLAEVGASTPPEPREAITPQAETPVAAGGATRGKRPLPPYLRVVK